MFNWTWKCSEKERLVVGTLVSQHVLKCFIWLKFWQIWQIYWFINKILNFLCCNRIMNFDRCIFNGRVIDKDIIFSLTYYPYRRKVRFHFAAIWILPGMCLYLSQNITPEMASTADLSRCYTAANIYEFHNASTNSPHHPFLRMHEFETCFPVFADRQRKAAQLFMYSINKVREYSNSEAARNTRWLNSLPPRKRKTKEGIVQRAWELVTC